MLILGIGLVALVIFMILEDNGESDQMSLTDEQIEKIEGDKWRQ